MYKKIQLSLVFVCLTFAGYAQTSATPFKDLFKTPKDSAINYPVFGKFSIENGGTNYKTLELWVFDKNQKIVYHTLQNMPTAEIFADFINKMIDKDYISHMNKHGLYMRAQHR